MELETKHKKTFHMRLVRLIITILLVINCAIVLGQSDTIIVIYKSRKAFDNCKFCPYCFVSRDTLYINRGCNTIDGAYSDTSRAYSNCYYYKFFTENGSLIAEGEFNDESCCGKYFEYYKNGKVKVIGYFDFDGNRRGVWFFYNKRGRLIRESKYD